MTLYTGAPKRAKLDGPERALDGIIGLVILIVTILIGFLAYTSLEAFGVQSHEAVGARLDRLQDGFLVAAIGGGIGFVLTTIIWLVRLARGRRSWAAPLWGLILVTVACVIGYLIMLSAL